MMRQHRLINNTSIMYSLAPWNVLAGQHSNVKKRMEHKDHICMRTFMVARVLSETL